MATIFGKPPGFFEIKTLCALDEMDPERLKLNHALGYNGSVRSAKNKYALFPPLLYLNNNAKEGINGLFRSHKLMEVCKNSLMFKSSLLQYFTLLHILQVDSR